MPKFKSTLLNRESNIADPVHVDVRANLKDLFEGAEDFTPFAFTAILRRADKTQHVYTYNELKKESDLVTSINTSGIWPTYDVFIKVIKDKYIGKELMSHVGSFESDSTLFFVQHDVEVSEEDSIVEIKTDDKGEPVYPIEYIKRFSIKDVKIHRGANGRVEYLQLYASKSD